MSQKSIFPLGRGRLLLLRKADFGKLRQERLIPDLVREILGKRYPGPIHRRGVRRRIPTA